MSIIVNLSFCASIFPTSPSQKSVSGYGTKEYLKKIITKNIIKMLHIKFPKKIEYNPVYQNYIDLVGEENFFEQFDNITNETIELFNSISKEKLNYKYAPEKWTIKEVLMHIIDTERGFSYRAIVCLRNDDKTPLYGMDEDFYAKNVNVTDRDISSMIEEFQLVRKAFRILFEHCNEEQSLFLGNGIGHKISARALGFISIGHTKHHLNIIKERYL